MKNIIILIFVLILLVGCSKAPEPYMYGDFEITPIFDGKVTFYQIKLFVNNNPDPLLIILRNEPPSLEDIPIQINKEDILSKKQTYIIIDPDKNLTSKTAIAAVEIDKIIDNPYLFNLPTNSAFTLPNKKGIVKTCEDVNSNDDIIYLRLAEKTQIYTEENGCVIIEATTEDDLIRAANRFALTILGIMQP